MPLEIFWSFTVSWKADDVTCRVMVFFRIVGFYLSGFVMIVISIDRLSAIKWPIMHKVKKTRTKLMLLTAWIAAPLCAIPQVFKDFLCVLF